MLALCLLDPLGFLGPLCWFGFFAHTFWTLAFWSMIPSKTLTDDWKYLPNERKRTTHVDCSRAPFHILSALCQTAWIVDAFHLSLLESIALLTVIELVHWKLAQARDQELIDDFTKQLDEQWFAMARELEPAKEAELERRQRVLIELAGPLDYRADAAQTKEWLGYLKLDLECLEDVIVAELYDDWFLLLERDRWTSEEEPLLDMTKAQRDLLCKALDHWHESLELGWLKKVKTLASIDQLRADHMTELQHACLHSQESRVKKLLEMKADPLAPMGGVAGAPTALNLSLGTTSLLGMLFEHLRK
jgi:hypothetical protein